MKSAKCDRTGKEINLADGFFTADTHTGDWLFTSVDAPEKSGEYNIPVKDVVKSPAALVDWMAHLAEKAWFVPERFFSFMTAFRQKNNLFSSL